jgi:hypothetical protein
MPAGRPTKYKPEHCKAVLAVGEEGGWLSEMAEACDVHRSTIDEWAANYPEFSEALTRAKQKAQVWFERTGRVGMFADRFNSSLWAKQMAARHPAEYSEKQRLEHTGANGAPITVRNATDLTDDQLAAIAATSRD